MRLKPHIALYGSTSIPRGYCSECEGYAFILDGKLACCDERVPDAPMRFKRMSDCGGGRKGPSKKWQDWIMLHQRGQCFYCERRFGSKVYRAGRTVCLRVHWDHVNPYVYSLDNRDQNFVAACHVCNGIKSSLIFRSADEAISYIIDRWKDKGYSDVPPVRIALHPETDIAKVLHPSVPPEGLV